MRDESDTIIIQLLSEILEQLQRIVDLIGLISEQENKKRK